MDVKTPQKTILEVRARRERLRTLMDRLEAALAAPVPGREAAWLKGVRAAFGELAAAVTDHIAEVEAANGLFAQVRDREGDRPDLLRFGSRRSQFSCDREGHRAKSSCGARQSASRSKWHDCWCN